MEQAHWLGRKKASLEMAENAAGSEARLIHYDLAGRYGLKATSAETQAISPADPLIQPIYAGGLVLAAEDSDNA